MDASQPPKIILDLAPSLQPSGFRLVDAGELYTLLSSILGIVGGLAGAGTTGAASTALKPGVSVYTPTAGQTGVQLPPGLPGQEITVVNASGTTAGVLYGNVGTGDQIVPLASATPGASTAMAAGTTAVLVCTSKNYTTGVATWKVVSLG
jgi:hypothetical protein